MTTESWPKNKPPGNVQGLERWVRQRALITSTTPDLLQRGISAMVMAGMLGRVTDDSGNSVVLVKGGTHMLLRYGSSARPSKDFDVAITEDAGQLQRILEEATREPYLGFEGRLTGPPEPVRDTGSVRAIVKLTYESKPWQSVKVEAAANEAPAGEVDFLEPSPDLGVFGFTTNDPVPCLPARFQIAQKLHAVTEVWQGQDNDRFRDLLDLQLLATEVDRIGLGAVREACLQVFERRNKHPWPPQVRVYPTWGSQYAQVAARINFPVTDVEAAARAVTDLVAYIDTGRRKEQT